MTQLVEALHYTLALYVMTQLVEALHYKPEVRGFDSRLSHRDFIDSILEVTLSSWGELRI